MIYLFFNNVIVICFNLITMFFNILIIPGILLFTMNSLHNFTFKSFTNTIDYYENIIRQSFVELMTMYGNGNAYEFNNEEQQYLDILSDILETGFTENGRNGETISKFGNYMRFSLTDNTIPILTCKKVAWKTCLKELLWFIRGETDAKLLQKQGVHIWDGNTSREFLDSRGLETYPEGVIGPGYGFQWRSFNADYDCLTGKPMTDETHYKGIDQLQQIIDQLKDPEKRNNRRIIMSAWNPCQLDQMALPPCHILCQFNVHDGDKLSCALYQRSCDVPVGVPFNIASYCFLTHLLAKHCGLKPYEFIHFMGNVHIYEQHVDAVKTLINRRPFDFPKLNIKNVKNNINDYEIDDFEVIDYICWPAIKMDMIV